ncbi:uncharacterized protein LOC127285487 isoform X2 [Leptopilina boulardi]|uniref:uncharacterized protein LOC127285487 isoform X2 n=1 Tax=Leptopilina boulardi TaxID=63433 RepID=UPI0021F64DF2|nr:uncharacterized protein LOC127285487 isoform X2 [Leptopilina boulardi]
MIADIKKKTTSQCPYENMKDRNYLDEEKWSQRIAVFFFFLCNFCLSTVTPDLRRSAIKRRDLREWPRRSRRKGNSIIVPTWDSPKVNV